MTAWAVLATLALGIAAWCLTAKPLTDKGKPMTDVPTCSDCQRERTLGDPEHPMDSYNYTPMQVFAGQPFGWYSGDDGEICPECFTALFGRANS